MWEMEKVIYTFTWQSINLLWIFELYSPIGPKESLRLPENQQKVYPWWLSIRNLRACEYSALKRYQANFGANLHVKGVESNYPLPTRDGSLTSRVLLFLTWSNFFKTLDDIGGIRRLQVPTVHELCICS